jgi:Sec-independent protein translocase protein TatA
MLNLGVQARLIVLMIALIVVGLQKLPQIAKLLRRELVAL